MNMFAGLLGKLFIMFFVVMALGLMYFQSSLLSSGSYSGDNFGFAIDGIGFLPLNAQGANIPATYLAEEDQKKLVDKIRARSGDSDARKSLENEDYRLIAITGGSHPKFINIACDSGANPGQKLTLYIGSASNGYYWEDLEYSWLQYGEAYNYRMLHGAPAGQYKSCQLTNS